MTDPLCCCQHVRSDHYLGKGRCSGCWAERRKLECQRFRAGLGQDLVVDPETPRTRTTDKVTSHLAEAEVKQTGKQNTHALATLELVRQFGPATSSDLAKHEHQDLHADYYQRREQIRRRLGELEEAGWIASKRLGDGREVTWWVVEKAVVL